MVFGGAFDCFEGTHRAQYFSANEDASIIEKAIKFSNALQANENANQQSLFGGGVSVSLPEPIIPVAETWSLMEQLKKEKEVILKDLQTQMRSAAGKLDFERAAELRDIIFEIKASL